MENEFDNEDYPIINMEDDETGEEIEFIVMDSINVDGKNYFLVVESENLYDDNAEALLLKQESSLDEDEITYTITEDDVEFEKVINLLNESNDDYDIQF